MTLNTGIFDVSDPLNPDRVYSAALLCRMMAKQIRDGIVHGDGNEMAVTVTDPPAMTILVGTGTAMVQGRFCESDAALTLAVTTAHATYPRIDRVVVRLNASPGRVIDIVVKPGTAAPEPAAPALTRTAEIWELSLAQVRVEAGATSILSAKITDERGNSLLCGVAAPQYVPSSQLEVVGAVNMQSNALTGLPAPSGSTDAARKGYVDAEVASSRTLSNLTIDGPKDWQGMAITNMGALTLATAPHDALLVIYPSSTVLASSPTAANTSTDKNWHVLKSATVSHFGVVRVTYTQAIYGIDYGDEPETRITVDGVPATPTYPLNLHTSISADVTVRAGSVVAIEGRSGQANATQIQVTNAAFKGSAGCVPYSTRTPIVTITQS